MDGWARFGAYVHSNGVRSALRHALLRGAEIFLERVLRTYDRFYRRTRPTEEELDAQRTRAFHDAPLISVLVPVYNTAPEMLKDAAASFKAQTYPHWEAVLLDGDSTRKETRDALEEIAGWDERLRVIYSGENRGTSGNSNAALRQARGEWIALCDHDDLLTPDALYWAADAIECSQPDLIYSDEDRVSEDGRLFFEPHFKPDYCPDNLRSGNYICHLTVLRRTLAETVGGFRSSFDGSQDHDLVLRCAERTSKIVHIPRVLYHWRLVESSLSHQNLARCLDASRRAVEEHLCRIGEPGSVMLANNCFRVCYALAAPQPVSAVLLDSSDEDALRRCAASVFRANVRLELLIVTRRARLPEGVQGKRIPWGGGGRFSAINRGATEASGAWLLLLDSSVEPEGEAWLTELTSHLQRTEVAAVIPAIDDRWGRILHAGYALGMAQVVSSRLQGLPRTAVGRRRIAQTVHNVGAVSAVCAALRRERFVPFDESYQTDLGSADWSLRLRDRGGWLVFTPFCRCRASADAPVLRDGQGFAPDEERFRARWGNPADPCYSPHFSRCRADFRLDWSLQNGRGL